MYLFRAWKDEVGIPKRICASNAFQLVFQTSIISVPFEENIHCSLSSVDFTLPLPLIDLPYALAPGLEAQ